MEVQKSNNFKFVIIMVVSVVFGNYFFAESKPAKIESKTPEPAKTALYKPQKVVQKAAPGCGAPAQKADNAAAKPSGCGCNH